MNGNRIQNAYWTMMIVVMALSFATLTCWNMVAMWRAAHDGFVPFVAVAFVGGFAESIIMAAVYAVLMFGCWLLAKALRA